MDAKHITMTRPNLNDLPQHDLPPGYSLRMFAKGEERQWAEVQTSAGAFDSLEAALRRFEEEFAPHIAEMESRCLMLVEDSTGRVIGSATAWYDDDFRGESWGRIHWVAIIPEFQGRKLAKPMLAAAMKRLSRSHSKAYMSTSTHRNRAVQMYLDYGFEIVE